MKKIIIALFIFSIASTAIIAQAKPTFKNLPAVFKMLQKPSYRQVMAKVQSVAIANSGLGKQPVKDPYLIYTQLWDTGAKQWAADTFEKYVIAWDVNKNLQSITDESWDSVTNGAVINTIETGFTKIAEPVSIDNNLSVNYFPTNVLIQELQNGKWVNTELETVTLDKNNLITSVLAQQWSQNTWTDYVKYNIGYDTKGDLNQVLAYYSSTGSWTLIQGLNETFTFNSNGFITSMLQTSSTGGAFVNNTKETFQLDGNGAITNAMIWTYDTIAGQWMKYDSISNMTWLYFDPILRIDYQTLSTDGILGVGGDKYLGYTEDMYDTLGQRYTDPDKNIYTYNADSLPTNIINQTWQTNAYVNNTSDSTSYYPRDDIKTYLARYWSNGWHNTSSGNNNINKYDGDDDITECIAQNTDANNANAFDNYSKTEYLYNTNSGIVPVSKSTFKIYPNPVSNCLNIDMGQNTSNNILTIIDITGKTIQTQYMVAGSTNMIDVTNLPSGMYFVSINNWNAVSTGKFIKE